MEEIWKDIKGFEAIYQISNLGRVKSLKRSITHSYWGKVNLSERIKKAFIDRCGYYSVMLHKESVKKSFSVHRLVALAFIPNENKKLDVNHKNGIKTDNRLENLEWMTRSENVIHSLKTRLKIPKNGNQVHNSILSKENAIKIKYEHKDLTHKQIAKLYGIDSSLVSKIRRNLNWKHI
jgi:hypothetical protein